VSFGFEVIELGQPFSRASQPMRNRALFATRAITAAALLSACVTATPPEMAWVRTDGRKTADDPGLLRQGKSDIATCSADLDSGTPTASAKGCMAVRGYVLVRKDQAEELRAAYAAAARKGTAQDEQR
jgi:hypothetical protein